jgi:hypothetical protein
MPLGGEGMNPKVKNITLSLALSRKRAREFPQVK